MTVKEYLEKTFVDNEYNVRPRIKCNDGFSVSVQGGTRFHYCSPRQLCNIYSEVELGFPSRRIPELDKYAEEKKRHTKTVFAYVPIEKVERLIEQHGGM